jgi:alanine racemase
LEIDLDCLAHNVQEVRRLIGPGRKFIAVAKADGYGHGVIGIASTLIESGADVVALGNLNTALDLRSSGFDAPILLFGSYRPTDVARIMVSHNITPTIWDLESAKVFSIASQEKPFDVYIKIDTGLNRLGIRWEEAAVITQEIAALPNLRIACVYTHFASPFGDEWDEVVAKSFQKFVDAVEAIRAKDVTVPCAVMASSAIISTKPEMYLDGVDPGRLLYGFYYPKEPPVSLQLKSSIKAVKTMIIQVKHVNSGDTIGGYGTYRADHDTKVGVLPIGWSDGLPRSVSPEAMVLINGEYCPIIEIHTEHSLLDLSEILFNCIGDEVIIIGKDKGKEITVNEFAEWGCLPDTEVSVRLGNLLPRKYFKGDKVVFTDFPSRQIPTLTLYE